MLQLLTRYFFKHNTVTIPHVGTLVLKEQPAYLKIAEKTIHPPVYSITYNEKNSVDERQIRILSDETGADNSTIENDLSQLGKKIAEFLHTEEDFYWKGIGKFRSIDEKTSFESIAGNHFSPPVSAQRVIRQNVQHKVLVGDSTITSHHSDNTVTLRLKKRSVRLLPYWIILLFGILFILFHFYKEGFNTSSAGYKSTVVPKIPAPTYQK